MSLTNGRSMIRPIAGKRCFKGSLLALGVIALAGCIHQPLRTPVRLGWVKAVVEITAISDPEEHPCVTILSPQERAAHRWVIVGVRNGRYRRLYTVVLPDGMALQRRDRVWIDPTDCAVALRRDE